MAQPCLAIVLKLLDDPEGAYTPFYARQSRDYLGEAVAASAAAIGWPAGSTS